MTRFRRGVVAGIVLGYGAFVASLPFLPQSVRPFASMAVVAMAWWSAIIGCGYVAWTLMRSGR